MQNIDSDLIRGNIDTIILKTMIDGDKYGLDIIKEVETRSNGTYELKQPTLYSCLKRLENQELISSYWLDSDIGGKRHYYKLTEKGRDTLAKKQEEWSKSKFIIDNLLSNFNYDEYRLVKKNDYDRIIEGKQFEYTPAAKQPSEDVQLAETDNEPSEQEEQIEDTETVSDIEEIASDEQSISSENSSLSLDDNDESSTNLEEDSENFDEYNQDNADFENESFENENQDNADFEDESFEDENQDNADFEDKNSIDDGIIYSNQAISETQTSNSDLGVDENNQNDQSDKESNILAKLRSWNNEEINEYVGDKTSYLNFVNNNGVQQNILDLEPNDESSHVDGKIDEFTSAIEKLNNFNSDQIEDDEDANDVDNYSEQNEEVQENSYDEEQNEDEQTFEQEENQNDDFLSELDELNDSNSENYFESNDEVNYNQISENKTDNLPAQNSYISASNENYQTENYQNASFDDDYSNNYDDSEESEYEVEESTNESFDNNSLDDEEDTSNYNFESNSTANEFDDENDEDQDIKPQTTSNYSDFDSIISKSANDYKTENSTFNDAVFEPFKPSYTSENYKQKLSNLSAYSKTSLSENSTNNDQPAPEIQKTKDIASLKDDFEKEGIRVKEFKRIGTDDVEKNYLLINKINMVRSLILLFGYIFILSAIYIIFNNTSLRDMHDFSIKYFLYGFIPFGVYALVYVVLYLINPYKKIPAKYAPRIMLFISIIITVQLLLITYCVNLQIGFYSFTQTYYNHLLWIIPTIISFAPIVSNLIFATLFYSKNFNV